MNYDNIAHIPRLRIGEAARFYGLSLRAIRLYEERGLVSARRDRLNNRYFDGANRRKLEWISLLRSAGVGLDDIREVLAEDDRNGRGRKIALEKLGAHRRAVEVELTLIDLATLKLSPPPTQAAVARRGS